ncbi:MAG: radical SAM protein, partial [Verrucomicrobiota bacterium]
ARAPILFGSQTGTNDCPATVGGALHQTNQGRGGTRPSLGQNIQIRQPATLAAEAEACDDHPPRPVLARQRALLARQALANCHLCRHHCGVNRLAGKRGLCHAGAETRIFSAQTEVTDELELIPTFAIALSGCDLRCDFCITGAQSWNPSAGHLLDVAALAGRAAAALAAGARTVQFLGGEPTIHLSAVLEIVAALPAEAKLVWKTNAHGSKEARALLSRIFDVWLADYKFGNDACALRLAKICEYVRIVQGNLFWARQQADLIVRHLLMPGHVDCCWEPVASWLAANLPGVKVSLRSGFWPAWQAGRHPELREPVSNLERTRAFEIARQCRLNLVN